MLKHLRNAVLTVMVFFLVFGFVNRGERLFDVFTRPVSQPVRLAGDVLFTVLYLFANFTLFEALSRYYGRKASSWPGKYNRNVIEALSVVGINWATCLLLYMLPMYLLLDGEPVPEKIKPQLRLAFALSTFISLFYYFFVERARNEKLLARERLRNEQLEKENFKAQYETLKSQVNPHFLFNNLNVLSSLIYRDQAQAAQFLNQLSVVYRSILDNREKELVTLNEEMELMNAYLFLLKTRFRDSIRFQTDIPFALYEYELPPLVLQMLVENAIKHNVATLQKPLLIRIVAQDHGSIAVINNLQPRPDGAVSTKVGLSNIRNRFKYFTNQPVEVSQTGGEFKVVLPLLNLHVHESNHPPK
jgi:sensor histidine kinase YesM